MSARSAAPLFRATVARRAAQPLRNPVLKRRFATEGGPNVVSLLLDAACRAEYQPPASKPRAAISPYALAGVGAAALGAAYLFFGTSGSAQETAKELGSDVRGAAAAVEGKLGLRRGKDEYQKVYDAIASELEVEDYDGEFFGVP